MIKLFLIFRAAFISKYLNSLTPELIFLKLFPDKTYNNTYLRKILSEFGKLIKKYFSRINIERYPHKTDLHLLKEINQRDNSDIFLRLRKKSFEHPKNYTESGVLLLFNKFELLYEELRFFSFCNNEKAIRETVIEINNIAKLANLSLGLSVLVIQDICYLLLNLFRTIRI